MGIWATCSDTIVRSIEEKMYIAYRFSGGWEERSLEEERLNGRVEYYIPLLLPPLHLRNLAREKIVHLRSLRSLVVGMMTSCLYRAPK